MDRELLASAERPSTSDRGLWLRWVAANAAGEFVGLGLLSLVAILVVSVVVGDPSGLSFDVGFAVLLVALGTLEGAVVGTFQWTVLRRRLPSVASRDWVGATAIGAFVAWALGMAPSTLQFGGVAPAGMPVDPGGPLLVALAAAMGAVLGLVLAGPQWFVLRRHVNRAWWWFPANAAGWAVGMPVVFLGVGAAAEGGFGLASAAVVLAAVALAGAVVGAVHGLALVRVLRG